MQAVAALYYIFISKHPHSTVPFLHKGFVEVKFLVVADPAPTCFHFVVLSCVSGKVGSGEPLKVPMFSERTCVQQEI